MVSGSQSVLATGEPCAAGLRDAAARGGDDAAEAFAALWDAYYRRLMVFAAAYRGLPAGERHDAVADALIAAFGALPGFDPRRRLSPWVYRIAANRFSDAVRRARRESTIEVGPADSAMSEALDDGRGGSSVVEPVASGDHAAESADRDLAERCAAAIAALPEADRRVATLRFYEGFSAADIGRALGMPAGTVRWRVGAIRRAIRAATGEEGT
ncbi:MAG: sigma-70 family RNA polymerase sigma factor [Spirochaetaceae bacterium]|nr:sigma-70 family RNA polymerase sigma factor [Spirochaetaceae bacterium]